MGSAHRSSPGPFVLSCETFVGDDVVNAGGEDLGRIAHIVLDVFHGKVVYAVLACGGVFGIGEKLFAVPWSALTLDAGRRCLVLDIPKDRLERAGGFDREHWPAMADPAWARELHDAYGAAPYWEDGARLQ
jgi:hypothetical protein